VGKGNSIAKLSVPGEVKEKPVRGEKKKETDTARKEKDKSGCYGGRRGEGWQGRGDETKIENWKKASLSNSNEGVENVPKSFRRGTMGGRGETKKKDTLKPCRTLIV